MATLFRLGRGYELLDISAHFVVAMPGGEGRSPEDLSPVSRVLQLPVVTTAHINSERSPNLDRRGHLRMKRAYVIDRFGGVEGEREGSAWHDRARVDSFTIDCVGSLPIIRPGDGCPACDVQRWR